MNTFQKRLKYEKYKNMGNIITIDLHNGYTVIAIIGRTDGGEYDIELRLKANGIDHWELIEKAEHIVLADNISTYPAILKLVSDYLSDGFFDYYIDRYEYELKCFDIGDTVKESERLSKELGKVNAS